MADISQAIKDAKTAAAHIMGAKAAAAHNIEEADVIEHQLPAASAGGGAVVLNQGKRSMASLGVSKGISSQISAWLKIDKVGFSIDNDAARFDDIEVEINMSEGIGFYPKESIKWGDAPPNYASCYEGNITDKNLPWDQTVQRALAVDPKCKGIYPSVDIILTVLKDIPLKERGKFISAGTKLGYTSATTHWENFRAFFNALMIADELGKTHKVKLTATVVTSKKTGNVWGVPTFELAA